jgi:hypothetical protein
MDEDKWINVFHLSENDENVMMQIGNFEPDSGRREKFLYRVFELKCMCLSEHDVVVSL